MSDQTAGRPANHSALKEAGAPGQSVPPQGEGAGDPRIAGVERVLAREGIAGQVTLAGHASDVAALAVAPEHLARLAELAPEIKALGFRYVAIELDEVVVGDEADRA